MQHLSLDLEVINEIEGVDVDHHPYSPRYQRAYRRRNELCYGTRVGYKVESENDSEKVFKYSNFVRPHGGETYGAYTVFEIFYRKLSSGLEPLYASIIAYYDGRDESKIAAKSLEEAKIQESELFPQMIQY